MANTPTKEVLEGLLDYTKSTKQEQIIEAVIEFGSGRKAAQALGLSKSTVNDTLKRVKGYAASKGYAPEQGVTSGVPENFNVKKVSTLRNGDGEVTSQWVIAEAEKVSIEDSVKAAMNLYKDELPVFKPVDAPQSSEDELLTTYVTNDLHLGALVASSETGEENNLELGVASAKKAIEYLVASSPNSKQAIVVDLGDLTEARGYSNLTEKGGHLLDVSSRYPDVLRAAYELLAYFVGLALTKHETVYFYNVGGNHDNHTALAVREVIRVMFMDNPRVIVDDKPTAIKYHQHGATLLQFFHGDKMKMNAAGEVMAFDCQEIFSQTKHRYGLCGHFHKDSVVDSRLSRTESFRSTTVMNEWATSHGFRGGIGTMQSITYSNEHGEVARNTYNVAMG